MDVYFNGYKIRYELLNNYILPLRASMKIRKVNIFINVDDLFHKLHKPYTNTEFQCIGTGASKQLISNLINLIGHYKNWAIKEGLYPKIYLVYTTSKLFKNSIRRKSYREHYIRINDVNSLEFFNINDVLSEAYPLLQTLIKYIPNAYIIDSGYVEPSVIPLFLSHVEVADLNIMVSRDEYDLQYSYMDKWVVISPKGDNSSFIVKGNLWQYIQYREKIDENFNFHPEVFLWAKSIIGDKYRGIPKLTRTGWKTIIKYLKEASSFEESKEMFDLQLYRLTKYMESKKIDVDEVNSNMYCTSIIQQEKALLEIDKGMIINQLVDMEDVQSLRNLNNTAFRLYPLNLQFILKENVNTTDSPNAKYFWMK